MSGNLRPQCLPTRIEHFEMFEGAAAAVIVPFPFVDDCADMSRGQLLGTLRISNEVEAVRFMRGHRQSQPTDGMLLVVLELEDEHKVSQLPCECLGVLDFVDDGVIFPELWINRPRRLRIRVDGRGYRQSGLLEGRPRR